jgi:hypothetical protein
MTQGHEDPTDMTGGALYKYLGIFFASDHADYESNADIRVMGGEVWELRERILPHDLVVEGRAPSPARLQSEDSLITLARAVGSGVIDVAFSLRNEPTAGAFRRYRFTERGIGGVLSAGQKRDLAPRERKAMYLVLKDSLPAGF